MRKRKSSKSGKLEKHTPRPEKKILIIAFFLLILAAVLFRLDKRFLIESNPDSWENVIIDSGSIIFLSLNPQDKSVKVISLPENLYLKAAYGAGFYEAGKLWHLAKLQEKEPREFVAQTYANLFQIPIDSVINDSANSLSVSKKEDIFNLFGIKGFIFLIKNRDLIKPAEKLGLLNQLNFWRQVLRAKAGSTQFINLNRADFTENLVLPDNSEKLALNSVNTRLFLKDFFVDSRIRKENLKIEILNAAGESGLAEKGAAIVANLGGLVVKTGNYSSSASNCLIRVNPEFEPSFTLNRLAQAFHCQVSFEENNNRVDLSLILGSDFAEKSR